MKSGMLAAEAVYEALTKDGQEGTVATKGAELFDDVAPLAAVEVVAYETGGSTSS
jgi:hypothetical protein